MADPAFDKVGDQFIAYYDTVRGHVREQLTRQNLSPLIVDHSFEVLDIGGGDGRDAIWLAQQGHRVKLVDPSSAMLSKAQRSVESSGVGGLITLEQGDPENVLSDVSAQYDLVLSHGVLMYLKDPQSHLNLLSRLVKPSGTVSVLTKGRQGSLFRLLHKHDVSLAEKLRQTGRLTNNLGEDVLALDESTLVPMLQVARLSIYQTFGVRIAAEFDFRPISEVEAEELKIILEVEAELGRGERTKGMGQMMHFICKPQQGEKK